MTFIVRLPVRFDHLLCGIASIGLFCGARASAGAIPDSSPERKGLVLLAQNIQGRNSAAFSSAESASANASSAPNTHGAFVATLGGINGTANTFQFGGSVGTDFVTQRSYTNFDFALTVQIPPGAGNSWSFSLQYATLPTTRQCADITSWISVPLGTISGATQKRLSGSHIPVNIIGPACFHGQATLTGTRLALGGGTAAFHFSDGTMHYQTASSALSGSNGVVYAGNLAVDTYTNRGFWFNSVPVQSVGGVVALATPPGAGKTWHVQIAHSTAVPTSAQNCPDLAYSVSGDVGTISGSSQKSVSWSPVLLSIPANTCVQVRLKCTGGICATFGGAQMGNPNIALDVGTDNLPPYSAFATTYSDAGSGAFNLGHSFGVGPWAISDAKSVNGVATLDQQFWLAPASGLASCGGGFTFQGVTTGLGAFNVGLTTSTTAPTGTQACKDLAYTDSPTLCSMTSGSKECRFSMSNFAIPPNACFALKVKTSGGTPVNSGPFNWQATCTPANIPNAATVTVATVPSGLTVAVDNVAYTSPQAFQWTPGTAHSIGVASPQGNTGTHYLFSSWSDAGGQTHTVTAPSSSTTYSAAFSLQYLLTTGVAPVTGGGITANPSSPSGYYASGTSVALAAAPNTGFQFVSWTGDLGGTTNPQSVILSSPRNVTAQFKTNFGITAPGSLSQGTVGVPYSAVQFSATGGTGGYTWTATGMPIGMTFSVGGILSGILGGGSAGLYHPQFTVTDSSGTKASVSFALTVNSAILGITSSLTLPTGTVGSIYGPLQLTASGGTGVYTWSATGLADGVKVSTGGILSGTPLVGSQGSYSPHVTVADSGGAKQVAIFSIAVNPAGTASPPSISSISPNPVMAAAGAQTIFVNGGAFQNGAGLKVHLSNGTAQTDISGAQLTFLSATQLSILADVGATAAGWTATVTNPDNQSSNVFAFNVQVVQTGSVIAPQMTFGQGWYTGLYFANTTNSTAHVQANFYTDSGAPMTVPLIGIGSVTAQSLDLSPGSTIILEAPDADESGQGWAELLEPTGVIGYAVLRHSIAGLPDQEATVPLTPESNSTANLTYDDSLSATSIALLNPTDQTATVAISTFDSNGLPNGVAHQVLAPRSKLTARLKDLPGLATVDGERGRAVFSTPQGSVSVLGLRLGTSTFRTIPSTQPETATQTRATSLTTANTRFYFSNSTTAPVTVPVSFIDNRGSSLVAPLIGNGPVSTHLVNISPGGTVVIETQNPTDGWVEAAMPAGVTGYAVFGPSAPGQTGQEILIPLVSESSQTADLIYDDIDVTTSADFVNPSDQSATVTIQMHSAIGVLIGSTQIVLEPRSKISVVLKDLPGLSALSGNRGWASFSVPNGNISVLGLRMGADGLTSLPVSNR